MESSVSKWNQVSPSKTKWVNVKLCGTNGETKWDQVSASETAWEPSESKWDQVSASETEWLQMELSETKWV